MIRLIRVQEQLLEELGLISSLLNKKYNKLMLADTEEEEQSLQQEIDYLEENYHHVLFQLELIENAK